MTARFDRHHPLAALPPLALPGVIELAPIEDEARLNLRIHSQSLKAASDVFGLSLPERMGSTIRMGERWAACLGPDEWLLGLPQHDAESVKDAFAVFSLRVPSSLVEVTDRECCFRIVGPRADYALKSGCPYDVSKMEIGTVTRTLFDNADVLILRESDMSFRVQTFRSWTAHVGSLLAVVGREIATGL